MLHSPLHGDIVAVGRIVKAVGIEGLCGVEVFGSFLQNKKPPLQVFLGENQNQTTPAILEEISFRPGIAVCRFQDVNDRDAAQMLHDRLIFVESDLLPELDQDGYYSFELEGMVVYSEEGDYIGSVQRVHSYPSADTLEIKRRNGAELMIPLIADAILNVDKSKQRITVKKSFIEELL